jgi:hypothetical protein
MPIKLHFLIEFSREIWGEFAPTYGESLIICYSLIRSILIEILSEVLPLLKNSFCQIDGQTIEVGA